jgi:predicted DNA-binding transcriptional regulator AlpA
VKIIRPKEAQARLGIGHSKFYDAIKKGELPTPVRFGRVTGLLEDEFEAVIRGLKAARDRKHGEAA